MRVPEALAELLKGAPDLDVDEQAFPFLTVDDQGFPHVALLSRAELDVRPGRAEILVAVGSPRTRANLRRDGQAGLIAVAGTVAHYAKLRVTRSIEVDGLLGCTLQVVEHKGDSVGVRLEPICFRTSAHVAVLERWEVSARVLRTLMSHAGE